MTFKLHSKLGSSVTNFQCWLDTFQCLQKSLKCKCWGRGNLSANLFFSNSLFSSSQKIFFPLWVPEHENPTTHSYLQKRLQDPTDVLSPPQILWLLLSGLARLQYLGQILGTVSCKSLDLASVTEFQTSIIMFKTSITLKKFQNSWL
jgi:hypothetical protein